MPSRFGWPFAVGVLLLLFTLMLLHVWVQESPNHSFAHLKKADRTSSQSDSSAKAHFASDVTAAEVKPVPYTRGVTNPFSLPKAKATVYSKSPVINPISTPVSRKASTSTEVYDPFKSAAWTVSEESVRLAKTFGNDPFNEELSNPQNDDAWELDSDPDLNAEPNSPRNNLNKLAEVMPQTDVSEEFSSDPGLDPFIESKPIESKSIASEPIESEPRNPLVKFASTSKAKPRVLTSAISTPHRSPAQPLVEIVIPEWDPYAVWPKPTAIIAQLEELQKIKATEPWATQTHQLLKLLHWTGSIDDPNSAVIFQQLTTKLEELDNLCMQVSTVPVNSPEYAQGYLASRLRTFHYDIAKRVVLWSAMHNVAVHNQSQIVNEVPERNPMMQVSQFRFAAPNVGAEWSDYLALDELTQSFNSLNPNPKTQQSAARQTLTRYFSTALASEHHQFLDPYFDEQLLGYLRDKAAGPVNLSKLLTMIEYHEANPSGYSNAKVNDFYQSLLWSTDNTSQHLAAQLDSHYRNANVRISISDAFVNRMIPQQPESNLPINETVLGANIRGNGRLNNRLRIRLLPDNRKVNLRLEANGMFRSTTQARRSGFTVDNQGQTRYQAFKNLAISRHGVQGSPTQAFSETNSSVTRLRSNLDPIPLVGWMARRIAKDKIAQSTPLAEEMTDRRIEHSARQEIELQVHQQMATLQNYLKTNLMQPLIAMEMEPTPLEMRTTSDRIIMRYRLAGRDQMAAHTARPRALADSLMSLQFHESMINNLLDRTELKSREFTSEELVQHLRNIFRSEEAIGTKEMETDATFVFAPYDPLRIGFVDNKVELTLNLKKFRIGKGKTWKNLNIKATYHPSATGMKLTLVQDKAGISLKGSNLKLRDQIAVRTVFTAMFEDRYEMNILPKNFGEHFDANSLRIAQLAITDGWIGISLGEQLYDPVPYQATEQSYPASSVPVYNFRR